MKKITIYTVADKRPDFIPVQYDTLKKYIRDEYEYIVLNNAIDSRYRKKEIFKLCKERNIKCIEVKKDSRFNKIGGQKVFSLFGSYANPNVATAYPLRWAWEDMCEYNKDKILMVFDSDMFICNPISFNNQLNGYDAALMMQYRGLNNKNISDSDLVTYIWNALFIFDVNKIKNLKELNWDCGIIKKSYINGYSVDVGGYAHFWLKENKIRIKYLSEYAIIDHKKKNRKIEIKYTIGSTNDVFEYYEDNLSIIDQKKDKKKIPYLPLNFKKVIEEKILMYFKKYNLENITYNHPTFLGFIEFETFIKEIKPFIIHAKAGSGYLGLDHKYGQEKLDFIRKIVGTKKYIEKKTIKKHLFNIEDLLKLNIKTIVKMILKKMSIIDILK